MSGEVIVLPERYAQRRGGRKMHLVTDFGDAGVASVARCGATPDARGHWRMTSNVPWANACRNCLRAKARNRAVMVP